jgi:hypothetical protein
LCDEQKKSGRRGGDAATTGSSKVHPHRNPLKGWFAMTGKIPNDTPRESAERDSNEVLAIKAPVDQQIGAQQQ